MPMALPVSFVQVYTSIFSPILEDNNYEAFYEILNCLSVYGSVSVLCSVDNSFALVKVIWTLTFLSCPF